MADEKNLYSILIVDDEEGIREMLATMVQDYGWNSSQAADGVEALRELEKRIPSAMITDLRMPGMDGFQLFQTVRKLYKDLPVVMMSAYGNIETAVESIKCGAFDYLPKPFKAERIGDLLRSLEAVDSPKELNWSQQGLEEVMIGRCPAMESVRETIRRAAQFDCAVFLQGQKGTGKEFVARAIHRLSSRREEPFVVVSCSGMDTNAIERELLGYRTSGSSEGRETHAGLLEIAGRGTLFIDEIDSIPVSVQARLLQILEQGEFRPIGSNNQQVKLQARLMVATSRDIAQAVQNGQFHRDLFYRLHVLSIYLPPLRARSEDITMLIDHFMKKLAARGIETKKISPDALAQMVSYHWPGNVLELENCVERALVTVQGPEILREHLPEEVLRSASSFESPEPVIGSRLQDYEHAAVLNALQISKGNKRQAARILEVSIATLYKKLKDYNIDI